MASPKPSIVFAHGLWADGSCFSKLIPTLQREGHEVISAQNTLESLEGEVDAIHRALERVSAPAILVGHSWGGFVISAAGNHEKVAGLVYVAALSPEADESAQEQIGRFTTPELFSHLQEENGRIWIARDGISYFCGDLSPEDQQLVWATQGAPRAEILTATTDNPAWKSKPTWYLLTTQDQAVHPELQRFVSQRMGATTVEVNSSHVPMLSQPEAVLDLIRKAADAVAAA
ncbi:alpha/beta fold hydrolase [Streptomyces sp. NBC_00503]|uniref:alpha/beta fold hydrolase n=1 Tax=Streptomyces sp. NBC_00503 TaxID=2903659 RepID=UPI002E7FFA46|nr:alpha/beta hydrolase [Streptomyces sp. NBC_00503]WUD85519.1 alpha/beta hydrolase [Streptomyces sp. NBC_00503]